MDWLWRVDWAGLYQPKHALLDVFIRGTLIYLMIFVLLRLVVRRQTGGMGITDILVIVLIAEVTGNASPTTSSRSARALSRFAQSYSGAR